MCCLAHWPVNGTAGCKEDRGAQPWGATPVRHGAQSATVPSQEARHKPANPCLLLLALTLQAAMAMSRCLLLCLALGALVAAHAGRVLTQASPTRARFSGRQLASLQLCLPACTAAILPPPPRRRRGRRSIHSTTPQLQGQAQSNDPRSWVQSGTPQEVRAQRWRRGSKTTPPILSGSRAAVRQAPRLALPCLTHCCMAAERFEPLTPLFSARAGSPATSGRAMRLVRVFGGKCPLAFFLPLSPSCPSPYFSCCSQLPDLQSALCGLHVSLRCANVNAKSG